MKKIFLYFKSLFYSVFATNSEQCNRMYDELIMNSDLRMVGADMRNAIDDTQRFESVFLATYILSVCKHRGLMMNQTKLQKLMYVIYGSFLAFRNERICEEHPRAWPFGPVFPTAQRFFMSQTNFLNVSASLHQAKQYEGLLNDVELNNLIYRVISVFGMYSGKELSDWSIQHDTPWQKAIDSNNRNYGSEMSDKLIAEYFSKHVIRT